MKVNGEVGGWVEGYLEREKPGWEGRVRKL